VIPRLEPELAELIEEPDRSLSALLRAPLARSEEARDGLSFDARAALRAWLMTVLRDIHRALAHLAEPNIHRSSSPAKAGDPVNTDLSIRTAT
jgi:hypothetical protein